MLYHVLSESLLFYHFPEHVLTTCSIIFYESCFSSILGFQPPMFLFDVQLLKARKIRRTFGLGGLRCLEAATNLVGIVGSDLPFGYFT